MLCGCIMLACSGQAACCVAAVGDRWHYGPRWGSKRMPMVRVNCKDRCRFLLLEVTAHQCGVWSRWCLQNCCCCFLSNEWAAEMSASVCCIVLQSLLSAMSHWLGLVWQAIDWVIIHHIVTVDVIWIDLVQKIVFALAFFHLCKFAFMFMNLTTV